MLIKIMKQMRECRCNKWEFGEFLLFVLICVAAFGGGVASLIILPVFIAQHMISLKYLWYAIAACILGASSFAYIMTGDGH